MYTFCHFCSSWQTRILMNLTSSVILICFSLTLVFSRTVFIPIFKKGNNYISINQEHSAVISATLIFPWGWSWLEFQHFLTSGLSTRWHFSGIFRIYPYFCVSLKLWLIMQMNIRRHLTWKMFHVTGICLECLWLLTLVSPQVFHCVHFECPAQLDIEVTEGSPGLDPSDPGNPSQQPRPQRPSRTHSLLPSQPSSLSSSQSHH